MSFFDLILHSLQRNGYMVVYDTGYNRHVNIDNVIYGILLKKISSATMNFNIEPKNK